MQQTALVSGPRLPCEPGNGPNQLNRSLYSTLGVGYRLLKAPISAQDVKAVTRRLWRTSLDGVLANLSSDMTTDFLDKQNNFFDS